MLGFDRRTSAELSFAIRHPLQFMWRLVHACNIDFDKEFILEKENQLVDGALALPPPDRDLYKDEIAWLVKNRWDNPVRFPYCRVQDDMQTVSVGLDEELRLPYVIHCGQRVYFCRGTDVGDVERAYRNYVDIEGILGQGVLAKSPHAYVSSAFQPNSGDVIIDIGCSEGLFAINYAGTASHIYLFEAEQRWQKPLEATFKPYMEKTTIVSKFVGNVSSGDCVKLSDSVSSSGNRSYFIKMDIEGSEVEVISSSLDFLSNNKVKLSCCTYHRQSDAEILSKMLKDVGYRVSFSDGYMLTTMNVVRYPYFRHGVIFASNYD